MCLKSDVSGTGPEMPSFGGLGLPSISGYRFNDRKLAGASILFFKPT
jgi:hypothetical protein